MESIFQSDIQQLNTLYNRPQFSSVYIYGRYGTGKTAFVRTFCQGKRTLFFSFSETAEKLQLQFFRQEIIRQLCPAQLPPLFEDWIQAFSYLSGYSLSQRLVLVLDEIQYPLQHYPGFQAELQKAAAESFPAGKIFLVYTSSSVDFSARMTEASKAPFDSLSARAFLSAMPFFTVKSCFDGFSPSEQLLLYGVTGGLYSCLMQLDRSCSAKENIRKMFFESTAPLFAMPLNWLHRDLRETSTYNLLLNIIAASRTRLADIAEEASIGTNKCAKYLNVLIGMGILRREYPAVGQVQKKVRYVFADHMLRFWYRFVYPNISNILLGNFSDLWEQQIIPNLNDYLLPVFEDLCGEYLSRLAQSGLAPFSYRHTGSWWCGGTRREPYFRIPLVAEDQEHTVLGICHCGSSPADLHYLESLLRPLEPFRAKTRYCCIFSMSGFSRRLEQAAKEQPNIWLIDLEDMLS